MFKKMLGAFGLGSPTATTVPHTQEIEPGQPLAGTVHLQGGNTDTEISQVALVLVTVVTVPCPERLIIGEFQRVVVRQSVLVPAGAQLTVPFTIPVPWETPITAVGPALLPDVAVELRTELITSGAPVKVDPVSLLVQPMAGQDRVLDAVGELGLQFRNAEVVAGRVPEAAQELGFFQRWFFHPPARFAGRLNEVELAFVAGGGGLVVSLIADRRVAGAARYSLGAAEAAALEWESVLGEWLAGVSAGAGVAGAGMPGAEMVAEPGMTSGSAVAAGSGVAAGGLGVASGPGMGPALGGVQSGAASAPGHEPVFQQQQGYPGQPGHPGQPNEQGSRGSGVGGSSCGGAG
ncbi:sporulation protein [Crossiella sp. CA198]|uniref:sporulation protein n=1 Tax=Crossiella sp. CA198 TaxID=3455607 RepID=UPI003F8D4639